MSGSPLGRFRWFGRVLATEIPFVVRLPEATGAVDVTLRLASGSMSERAPGEPYRRIFPADSTPSDQTWLEAFALGDRYRLRLIGYADFEIARESIDCRLAGGTLAEAETFFLGLVSALWLESRGALCLHGAAVAALFGGIGFLGFNLAGKSSLAASFVGAGIPLLTDDVLALEIGDRGSVLAQPGFPQLRLWPSSASRLVADADRLVPVHPNFDKKRVPVNGPGLGSFHDRAVKLRALLLPERGAPDIELTRLTPREAMIELVRHSFLGALGEAAIGVERRFERLVAVAERVPVFRLSYPEGFEHLPRVRAAILEHLSAL